MNGRGRLGKLFKGPSKRRVACWALGVLSTAVLVPCVFLTGLSHAQARNADGPVQTYGLPPQNPLANPKPDANRLMEDSMHLQANLKRMRELNELRHKAMNSDTAKLVSLANELKAEIEKSVNEPPNMDEVRKVEQIEKLAHGVQTTMRATVSN